MTLLYWLFLFVLVLIRIDLLGLRRIYAVFFVHFLHSHNVKLINLVVLFEERNFDGMLVLIEQGERVFIGKNYSKIHV